jgi:hypothetical protein
MLIYDYNNNHICRLIIIICQIHLLGQRRSLSERDRTATNESANWASWPGVGGSALRPPPWMDGPLVVPPIGKSHSCSEGGRRSAQQNRLQPIGQNLAALA